MAMTGWQYIAVATLAGVCSFQFNEFIEELRGRKEGYTTAQAYAESVNKPLLVVGGPYGNSTFRRLLNIPAHGFGDVCLDINEKACLNFDNAVVADIKDIPYSDKFFGACLASHVLEHLPTIEDAKVAISELSRVADKVFIVSPRKTNLIAQIIPDHHLWVKQFENGDILLEQRYQ